VVISSGSSRALPSRVLTVTYGCVVSKGTLATATEAEQFLAGYRRRHCDAIGAVSCVMLRDRRDVPNCGGSMSRTSDGGFRHGNRHQV
jgi:hypothetical protein